MEAYHEGVPDRDIMYSRLAPHWRRPYRLAKGDASAAVVAAEADKALSATLRATGGCPGIRELADLVAQAVSSPEEQGWRPRADAIVQAAGGHKHTRIAQEVGEGLLEAHLPRLANLTADAIASEFAVAVLRRIAIHYAFGPIQPVLVSERFGSPSQAIAFESECIAEMRLSSIAAKLLKRPSAERLRTPAKSTHRKKSLESMLETWP